MWYMQNSYPLRVQKNLCPWTGLKVPKVTLLGRYIRGTLSGTGGLSILFTYANIGGTCFGGTNLPSIPNLCLHKCCIKHLFSGDENFFFCFVDVFLQAQTLDWGPTMRITPTRTMARREDGSSGRWPPWLLRAWHTCHQKNDSPSHPIACLLMMQAHCSFEAVLDFEFIWYIIVYECAKVYFIGIWSIVLTQEVNGLFETQIMFLCMNRRCLHSIWVWFRLK